jgi:alpha-mannosidase
VRQFLYGTTFFEKILGIKNRVFWLPDTFGYSGQLPQILKGFGIQYFMSQKLSWNLTNKYVVMWFILFALILISRFPHNTFVWEGIDGSKVLAHFPPADTYNSSANVKEIVRSCENNKSKNQSNQSLLLFGHGDGGGGSLTY